MKFYRVLCTYIVFIKTVLCEFESSKKIPVFISLNKNLTVKSKSRIRVNGNIYIFDIDNTLYKFTDEMKGILENKLKEKAEHFTLQHTEKELMCKFWSSMSEHGSFFSTILNSDEYTEEQKSKLRNFDFDIYKFIKRNEVLIDLIKKLKGIKMCFSNSSPHRAYEILRLLGLLEHIDFVFVANYHSSGMSCKPEEPAFNSVNEFIEKSFIIDSETCVYFFDDSKKNVSTASRVGWKSILISDEYTIEDALTNHV